MWTGNTRERNGIGLRFQRPCSGPGLSFPLSGIDTVITVLLPRGGELRILLQPIFSQRVRGMEVTSWRKKQGVPPYPRQFTESKSLRIIGSQNPLNITE